MHFFPCNMRMWWLRALSTLERRLSCDAQAERHAGIPKSPLGVTKAVRLRLSWYKGTCRLPWRRSSLEKTVEPSNFADSSSTVCSGYLYGITALFTCMRSMQGQSPPVFFLATTRLETQGEASTRSMRPVSRSFWSLAAMSSRKTRGNWHMGWMTRGMAGSMSSWWFKAAASVAARAWAPLVWWHTCCLWWKNPACRKGQTPGGWHHGGTPKRYMLIKPWKPRKHADFSVPVAMSCHCRGKSRWTVDLISRDLEAAVSSNNGGTLHLAPPCTRYSWPWSPKDWMEVGLGGRCEWGRKFAEVWWSKMAQFG